MLFRVFQQQQLMITNSLFAENAPRVTTESVKEHNGQVIYECIALRCSLKTGKCKVIALKANAQTLSVAFYHFCCYKSYTAIKRIFRFQPQYVTRNLFLKKSPEVIAA